MTADPLAVLHCNATGSTGWQWSYPAVASTNVRLQRVAGKGFGLVARRRIEVGERLLDEKPLAICSRTEESQQSAELIRAAVEALDASSRALFDALAWHGSPEVKTVEGVWWSNALPAGGEGRMAAATYAIISRINHSCQPSAHTAWNERTGRQTLHACQSIVAGEEISISYVEPGLTRRARQTLLREKFGFECACALCSLRGDALTQSDARQQRISEIDAITDDDGSGQAHPQMVSLVEEKLSLLVAEGLPRAWGHMDMAMAFARCVADQRVAEAKAWIEEAVEASRMLLGDDAQAVLDFQAFVRPHTPLPAVA